MEFLLVCCMTTLFGLTEELTKAVDEFDFKLKMDQKRLNGAVKELKKIKSDQIKKERKKMETS